MLSSEPTLLEGSCTSCLPHRLACALLAGFCGQLLAGRYKVRRCPAPLFPVTIASSSPLGHHAFICWRVSGLYNAAQALKSRSGRRLAYLGLPFRPLEASALADVSDGCLQDVLTWRLIQSGVSTRCLADPRIAVPCHHAI